MNSSDLQIAYKKRFSRTYELLILRNGQWSYPLPRHGTDEATPVKPRNVAVTKKLTSRHLLYKLCSWGGRERKCETKWSTLDCRERYCLYIENAWEKAGRKLPWVIDISLEELTWLTAPGCETAFRGFCEVGPISLIQGIGALEWIGLTSHHRNEFRKALALDKKDFATIEYLMRKGQRQLDMYSSPGIKDIR